MVRNLELYIASTLDWRAQISHVSQKVDSCLRVLYRLKYFLPVKTKATLMQSNIFPRIDYGDVFYFRYFGFNADLNKLGGLLNSIALYSIRYQSLQVWSCNLFHSSISLYFNHDRGLRSRNNLLLLCPSRTSIFINPSFNDSQFYSRMHFQPKSGCTRTTLRLRGKYEKSFRENWLYCQQTQS